MSEDPPKAEGDAAQPGRAPRRRRIGWALLAIGFGVVLGLFFAGSRVPKPQAAVSAPAPALAELAVPEVAAELPPAEELPEAVRRYLEGTVYPPSSGRLSVDHVDLLEPNRRYERPRALRSTLGSDPDEVVYVELSADRFDLTGREPTQVWLEARRGDEPLRLARLSGTLWREGRAGREGEAIPLDFRWDEPRHEAQLDLDAVADHHGFLVAEVHFVPGPGAEPQVELLRFSHTPEGLVPAAFTGQFHDYVREGSLRVEVGLDVLRPGFFRLDANLHDSDGAPLAYATYKGVLEVGRHHVPLEVFGKVLRDAGAGGPYTLGELRGYRFLEASFPDRETIPGTPTRWQTGAYAVEEFSDSPWDSEHKRQVVELMLQDEAAGIGVQVPPLPGGEIVPAPEVP